MNKKKSKISCVPILSISVSALVCIAILVPMALALPMVPSELQALAKDSPVHKRAVNLLKQDAFEKVIEIERLNLKNNPDDIKSYLLLTLAYLGKGDEKQARAQATHVNKTNPSYAAELYSIIARSYLIKKRYYNALHYFQTSLEIYENPKYLNMVGSIYLTQGRLKKAKEHFEKALDTDPDFLNISRIYLAEKDYLNSIRYANKVVNQNPEQTEGYILLGTAYLLSDELTMAESNFLKAKQLKPKLVLADYNLGLIHLIQKRFGQALLDFTRIVKLAPKIKEARIGRAAIQHIEGEFDHAKSEADQAIQIDPVDFLGHLTLANIHISEADFTSADNACRHAGNLFIEFTLPWFNTFEYLNFESSIEASGFTLVNIYHRNGLFQHGIDTVRELYAGKPTKNVFMLMMEARGEVRRANYNQAIQLYHTAIKLDPKLITPYMELGNLAQQRGDLPKAIDYYKKATQVEPELGRLYFVLGDLYMSSGDSKTAVSYYRRGLKYTPESSFGYNQIAWVLAEKEKKFKTALTFALKAFNLSPDSVPIRDTLGWIYFRMQRYKDAFRIYSEIDIAAINDPTVFYHLGMVHQKLGKKRMAGRYFEDALNITDEFPEGADAKKRLNLQ